MENIAYGASSSVFKTANSTIIKHPFPGSEDDLRCEQQAYELLGRHPRIANYHGRVHNDLACEMEYYQNGCIDQAKLKMQAADIKIPYLKWAEQIAEALAFIHDRGIIHCDLRFPNILVTDTFDVVLADFASCCIDGVKVSTVTNRTRFRPPGYEDPDYYEYTLQDDFFAFGSVVYTLVTSEEPHKDLTNDEVVELYMAGVFPDVSKWPVGAVISKCWRGEYSTASELLKDIRKCSRVSFSV